MHSTAWKKYLFSMFLFIGSIAVMSFLFRMQKSPLLEKKKKRERDQFIHQLRIHLSCNFWTEAIY